MMASALYTGKVGHVRFQPFRHAFTYRVFSLLLDMDDLPDLSRRTWIFSHNRFNLLSFHDRDHADGVTAPKQWVLAQLRQAGYPATESWQIRLLCFPRMLGFVFNPLAIYFCADAGGRLQALLHQVSNTFGERHSYLMPVAAEGGIVQACAKTFHVSPFMPVDGSYTFRIEPPGDRLAIAIHHYGPEGDERLVATQQGTRSAITTRTLARAFLSHPLMTIKVVAGIHWEALRLWRKGAPFFRKPPPPVVALSAVRQTQPGLTIAESIL